MSYDKVATLHSVWSFENKIKHPYGLLNSNLNYRYFISEALILWMIELVYFCLILLTFV